MQWDRWLRRTTVIDELDIASLRTAAVMGGSRLQKGDASLDRCLPEDRWLGM
jgi:hypothetical protein